MLGVLSPRGPTLGPATGIVHAGGFGEVTMERQPSRASLGSHRSGKSQASKYRVVAATSMVDESLFGNKKSPNGKAEGAPRDAAPKSAKAGGLRSTATLGASLKEGAVTVTKHDLERMLNKSSILTAEEAQALRFEREARREQERKAANERKARMLELEARARELEPPTESEMLKEEEDETTLARTRFLLDEERDEVKGMNRMMLYAKCVTIRDAQVAEKRSIQRETEEEERRMDVAMEIDRVKALEAYEERERRRAEEQRKGAAIIVDQIHEREQERIREEELRDLERQQLMREIERLKREDEASREAAKLKARQLMEEVMETNQRQLEMKRMAKQEEVEEDMRIAEYIRQRDLREQALAEEKERIAKEKELEIARLRAQQERANDRQAEIDELRARRYQEQSEREWRDKERREQERRERMQDELSRAREYQMASKVQSMAEMARAEKEDFERVLRVNMQRQREEAEAHEAAETIRRRHQQDLLAQIHEAEEKRIKQRQEHLEEGRKIRERLQRERVHLEMVKERKLRELRAAGVPEKYVAELVKMKVSTGA